MLFFSLLSLLSLLWGEEVESLADTKVHIHHNHEEVRGKSLAQDLKQGFAQTLENNSNLGIRSMGPAPARPVYRGLGGEHVQIQQDGASVQDLSSNSPDHAVSISASLLESISLLEGADLLSEQSSLDGVVLEADRGLFASKEESFHKFIIGGQSGQLGAFSGFKTHFGTNDFFSHVQGSYSKQGNSRSSLGEVKNTEADSWNMVWALQLPLGFQGSAEVQQIRYGVPGGFVGAHPNGVDIEMKKQNYRVLWSHDDWSVDAQRNLFSQIEFEEKGKVGAEFHLEQHDVHVTKHFHQGSWYTDVGVSWEQKDKKVGGFVFTPFTVRNTLSSFAQLKWQKKSWSIFTGLRSEIMKDKLSGIYAQRNQKSLPEAQLQVFAGALELEHRTSLFQTKGGLYQTSRLPSVDELYVNGQHLAAYSYEKGDPNLETEKGWGAVFSESWKSKIWKGNFSLYAWYYSSYIMARPTGEINWVKQLPVYAYSASEAFLRGAVWENRFSLTKQWKLKINASGVWGDDLKSKTPLPSIPPWSIFTELKHSISLFDWGWQGKYSHKQERVWTFEETTKASFVHNLFLQKQWSLGKTLFRGTIGVDNVLDTEWRNHLSRIRSVQPEVGRSYRANMMLIF